MKALTEDELMAAVSSTFLIRPFNWEVLDAGIDALYEWVDRYRTETFDRYEVEFVMEMILDTVRTIMRDQEVKNGGEMA